MVRFKRVPEVEYESRASPFKGIFKNAASSWMLYLLPPTASVSKRVSNPESMRTPHREALMSRCGLGLERLDALLHNQVNEGKLLALLDGG